MKKIIISSLVSASFFGTFFLASTPVMATEKSGLEKNRRYMASC